MTQLVSSPSVFTLEGMSSSSGQNYVTGNQTTLVVNQSFLSPSSQSSNYLGSNNNQSLNYVSANSNAVGGNQIKQVNLPQRKVSLLMSSPSGLATSEPTIGVDLENDR